MGPAWSVDSLSRLRERVESFGITLDMVPLPMSSSEISRSESPAIMLGTEPDRQKQIDGICEMIRNSVARRHSFGQVQPDVHRRSANRADARPWRRPLQHLRLRRRQAGSAADRGRQGRCRRLLGAHHPFPRARRARRRRAQGPARVSSAGSRHAERQGLARHRDRARFVRRPEAVRHASPRARITA